MLTLKKHLKQENVDSSDIEKIISYFSKKDCIKIGLYAAEDCLPFNSSKECQICIDLIKRWITNNEPIFCIKYTVDNSIIRFIYHAVYAINSVRTVAYHAVDYAVYSSARTINSAADSFGSEKESKLEEYKNYARLFAYEDLDFPHKDFSKTFNLDDNNDLNIFLDFLTDNYPAAVTYPREEYFTNKLTKEYLKVIYQ